ELVREAVEILGAERIGHGIALMHDHALAESLATRRIVLENCPTSNLCTGALAKQLGRPSATMQDHPLRTFIDHKWPVTLSTDDPGLFHTDLTSEYACAASLGLTQQQLLGLVEQSFTSAFLPANDKRHLLENFRTAAKAVSVQ
ncbi:MAG TPA: hypothetical protein VIY69_17870, partial [Candidatus Acidoferrales bacterium]